MALKKPLNFSGSSRSGVALPIWLYTWARVLPPRRFWPAPRSSSSRALSVDLRSGVAVLRTSSTLLKPVTMRLSGETCL